MRLLNHWKLKRLAQRENLKQLLPSPLATQATCRTLLAPPPLFAPILGILKNTVFGAKSRVLSRLRREAAGLCLLPES